eukprot:2745473-Prymnesium_polylepis.1
MARRRTVEGELGTSRHVVRGVKVDPRRRRVRHGAQVAAARVVEVAREVRRVLSVDREAAVEAEEVVGAIARRKVVPCRRLRLGRQRADIRAHEAALVEGLRGVGAPVESVGAPMSGSQAWTGGVRGAGMAQLTCP